MSSPACSAHRHIALGRLVERRALRSVVGAASALTAHCFSGCSSSGMLSHVPDRSVPFVHTQTSAWEGSPDELDNGASQVYVDFSGACLSARDLLLFLLFKSLHILLGPTARRSTSVEPFRFAARRVSAVARVAECFPDDDCSDRAGTCLPPLFSESALDFSSHLRFHQLQ